MTHTDIAIPKPPKPFRVDLNSARLARIKGATLLERAAAGLKVQGFVVRAAELEGIARHAREVA